MNLSKILSDLHHSSDVGNAVEGLAELAEALEKQIPDYERQLSDERMKNLRLGNEREALTAQLELMHQGVLLYLNNSITSKDEEVNWKKLVHILESNPQQCLAEIKAMAIEEAIGECLSAIDDNAAIKLVPFGYLLSEKWLLHYAEKIRRGDE